MSLVCPCCSWLVLAPRVLPLCTNHFVWVVCRPVWVSEACKLFLVPSRSSNTPLYPSKCCELRSVLRLLLLPLPLCFVWTHLWVLWGVGSALGMEWPRFKFFEKIRMEKHWNQSRFKCCNDKIVVDSTTRIIGISLFSNPLWDLTSIPKFSTLIYNPFWSTFSCIWMWGDLTHKVIIVKPYLI